MNLHHLSRTLQPAPIPINNPWNNVQDLMNTNGTASDGEKLNSHHNTVMISRHNMNNVSNKKENEIIRIKHRKQTFHNAQETDDNSSRNSFGRYQISQKAFPKSKHRRTVRKRHFTSSRSISDFASKSNSGSKYDNTSLEFPQDHNLGEFTHSSIGDTISYRVSDTFLPPESFQSLIPYQPPTLVPPLYGEFGLTGPYMHCCSTSSMRGIPVLHEDPVMIVNPFLHSPPMLNGFTPFKIPSTPNPFYEVANTLGMNNPVSTPTNRMQGIPLSSSNFVYPPHVVFGVGGATPPLAMSMDNSWNRTPFSLGRKEFEENTNEREQFNELQHQIRYYFSIENLCKDMYLRRQMDKQGFIKSSIIKGFTRVQQIIGDDKALFDWVVESIEELEIDTQNDHSSDYKIRLKDNWEKWVLKR